MSEEELKVWLLLEDAMLQEMEEDGDIIRLDKQTFIKK